MCIAADVDISNKQFDLDIHEVKEALHQSKIQSPDDHQSRDFYDYFNGGGGFRNPYDKDKNAVKVAKNPLIQGETAIMGVIANQKKYISIKTKIDDGSPLLDDIAIKEY